MWLRCACAASCVTFLLDELPFLREPGQVRFVALAGGPLALEERLGLGKDQGVRPALPSGLMADRQLVSVQAGMDMRPPRRHEWPLEGTPLGVWRNLASVPHRSHPHPAGEEVPREAQEVLGGRGASIPFGQQRRAQGR